MMIRKSFDFRVGDIFVFFLFFLLVSYPVFSIEHAVTSSQQSKMLTSSAVKSHHTSHELLVRFKPSEISRQIKRESTNSVNAGQVHSSHALQIISKHGHTTVHKLSHRHDGSNLSRWRKITLPSGMSVEKAQKLFLNDATVEAFEPNYIVTPNIVPNDTIYPRQWGMKTIRTEDAWEIQTDSSVIVAVIDSGIDYTHEDLSSNMWINAGEIPDNNIDDDNNGFIDDVYGYNFKENNGDPQDVQSGHGTHVAGIIGAVGNNGVGVTGVNWNVKIMALRFLSGSGGSISDAISSINYAVSMGATILNNSWGCKCSSIALKDAIDAAGSAGVLFVAAAGNAGSDNDSTPFYPAAYPASNILSVAASDEYDSLAYFTNFGMTSVDLAAPGVRIFSTGAERFCYGSVFIRCWEFDAPVYYGLSGTSMAAPHVSGALALVWSQNPSLTMDEVKSRLLENVDTIPSMVGKVVSGGRLNLEKSMVTVPLGSDFKLYASPNNFAINSGEAASFLATIQAGVDFSGPITLSVVSPNNLFSASLDQTLVNPGAGGSVQVLLNVLTSSALPADDYAVQVNATDALGRTKKSVISVKALLGPDFTIDISPAKINIVYGETAEYTLTIASQNNYVGAVNLEALTATPIDAAMLFSGDFPDGMTVSFDTNVVDLTANSQTIVVMTVTTSGAAPIDKNYAIQLRASGDVKTLSPVIELGVWRSGKDLVGSDITIKKIFDDRGETTTLNAGLAYDFSFDIYNQGVEKVSERFTSYYYLSSSNPANQSMVFLDYDFQSSYQGIMAGGGIKNPYRVV